jgi:hypothetical protein
MVLCSQIHPELCSRSSRRVNEFKTVPTTNSMTKVSSKPTNHSRFTSKCCGGPRCVGCHDSPVSKARTKAKKTHKHRQYDVAMNQLLVSHRVVGPGYREQWVRLDGQSASMLLNQLTNSFYDYDEFDNDKYEMPHDSSDDFSMFDREEIARTVGLSGSDIEEEGETHLGFFFVDFVRELAEDDDWCLVGVIN